MGHSRDQARGVQRPDELDRAGARKRPPEADHLLALQRSAGNRAVSALLARAPDTETKEDAKATGPRATLPGIGTIPLLSVSFPANRSPAQGGAGSGKSEGPRELTFTSEQGKHSSKLLKAALDGPPMEVEVVLPGGVVLKLKDAVVSHYSTSGAGDREVESWTLDFKAIEHQKAAETEE